MWFYILLHKLKIIHLIWIKLYDGSWELTWIHQKNPQGFSCYRFPISKIAKLQCNFGGVVVGCSYIDKWVDFDKQ